MKRVKEYMKTEMPILREYASMKDMLSIFSESHHNVLPVVNSAGKLIGLVSLKELFDDVLFSREDVSVLEKVSFLADFLADAVENIEDMTSLVVAKDIMLRNVFSVNEEDSMLKAAVVMKKKNIQRLIVLNNDNIPVGYVSRNEVCKAFLI